MMGNVKILSLVVVVLMQFVIGYVWYGHLFGGVLVADGGKTIDFMKFDILSLVLILLSGYGLTYIMETLTKLTGSKDIMDGLKVGLTMGLFGIGFILTMLLGLMGFGTTTLLVVLGHVVLTTMFTGMIVVKLKSA